MSLAERSFTLAFVKALIALFCLYVGVADAAPLVRFEPKPSDALLANPGMGWQTFQRFADQDKNLAGLPSSSAYFGFYWRDVEPQEGKIDFDKFDALLAHAARAGQKLAFRIMCTGSGQYIDVPAWLKEQGCRGVEFTFESKKHWVPDFDDPQFKKAHYRLIRELGRRYDGHPDLDLLDIGSVGLWAEWHMSGTRAVETGKPVPLPPVQLRMEIISEWIRAFPQTPKVILIGSEEGMARTVGEGLGWRADCLGDMGGFSKTWNHMDNFYRQQIQKTGAADAWKNGPVAFESCWDMRKWVESKWDVRHIFDYALDLHTSYINNKSQPLPEGTRAEVERVLRKMGYRLVLSRAEYPATAKRASAIELKTAWENAGVAPPYLDYRLAIRLRPQPGSARVLSSDLSIRGWLPGTFEKATSILLPSDIAAGQYTVQLGLVHPTTQRPEVRLAIETPHEAGWYTLGGLTVRN